MHVCSCVCFAGCALRVVWSAALSLNISFENNVVVVVVTPPNAFVFIAINLLAYIVFSIVYVVVVALLVVLLRYR